MSVLGLIPARGGSKGIPRKNVLPLAGRSLIQRAHDSAVEAGVLDRIIVSTEDPEIAEHARAAGLEVPFLRPPSLAVDEAPMIGVAVHALEALAGTGYRPDAVLLLQPTSPLRTAEHIRTAVGRLGNYDSVCSVVKVPSALSPHYVMKITGEGLLDFFMPDGPRYTRRQDVPAAYKRDGTIFLTRTPVILEQRTFYGRRCVPMVLTEIEVLSIDDPRDWQAAEQRLAERAPQVL